MLRMILILVNYLGYSAFTLSTGIPGTGSGFFAGVHPGHLDLLPPRFFSFRDF